VTEDPNRYWVNERCGLCRCWIKLSDVDGGIGICDCIHSDHNQHLIGYAHLVCDEFPVCGMGFERTSGRVARMDPNDPGPQWRNDQLAEALKEITADDIYQY